MTPFNYHAGKFGPVRVYLLAGDLDANSEPGLEQHVLADLDAGEQWLVFDLGGVTYLSSAGLRVFMVAYRRLQANGRVRLCNIPSLVRQVLDVTGLTFRLDPFPTLAAALENFPPQ